MVQRSVFEVWFSHVKKSTRLLVVKWLRFKTLAEIMGKQVGCVTKWLVVPRFVFESGFTGLWRICRIWTMRCIVFTLCSRVRHWDRLWSSPVKGEGDNGGCVVLLSPRPVDSRLRGNDGPGFGWFVLLSARHFISGLTSL